MLASEKSYIKGKTVLGNCQLLLGKSKLILGNMTKTPLPSFVILRTLRQITQKELADVLGVTEHTISNWERGKAIPKLTIPQTKALCNVLGVSLDELPDDFGKPAQYLSPIDKEKPPVASFDKR